MTDSITPSTLGVALRRTRREKRLSLRDLAAEIDVSFNTLSRVERGYVPDVRNYTRIVEWLDLPTLALPDVGAAQAATPDAVARHLFADPRLTTEGADRIAALVREMYQQLAEPTPAYAVHMRSAQTFLPAAGDLLAEIIEELHLALEQDAG